MTMRNCIDAVNAQLRGFFPPQSLHIVLMHDMLAHGVQDKLLRTLILECIGLAVHAFLRQQPHGDGTAARGRTDAWLARTTKPIMVNVRKGNFQFPEQQVRW